MTQRRPFPRHAHQSPSLLHSRSEWAILVVMDGRAHWDHVYRTKNPAEVSWYQSNADRSVDFIRRLGKADARIVDIGAGASHLVDALLDLGYPRPILLDISAAPFEHAKARLGSRAALVDWIVADITQDPSLPAVHVWHDRAVLHFLTDASAQQAYARLAARTVRSGGHAIIATFAPNGPERCSGLRVNRLDGQGVAALLGPEFELLEEHREVHRTPAAVDQQFCWSILRRE